jgi:hypothetical protein
MELEGNIAAAPPKLSDDRLPRQCGRQVAAADTRPDLHHVPGRIDDDLTQRARAHHDGVGEVGARAVPGALHGDPQPVMDGERRCGGHVVGPLGLHDRRRPLVHPEVPRPPDGVPLRSPGMSTFVRPVTYSRVCTFEPSGARIVWDLINIFRFYDAGRFVEEFVRTDNRSVLRQLGAEGA